jgi:hypothetical protein
MIKARWHGAAAREGMAGCGLTPGAAVLVRA